LSASVFAVGSNTFDLLCGIGLPYAVILLAAEGPGGKIDVDTSRLGPSLIVLLGVVAAYYLPLHFTKWYLGPKLGVYLLCLYAIYIALQLIEWQVGVYRRA
jgi:Ca2+/Na+ antiporter